MSKSVIEQALNLVEGQIAKRLHSVVVELPAAIQTMKELNAAATRLSKSWDGMSEVPDAFHMGVLEVLSTLDAFRSGYSSNANQSQGTVSQQFYLPTSIAGVAKGAADVKTEEEALKLFDEHFVAAVKSESNVEALGIFRVLRDTLRKDVFSSGQPTPASTEPDAALRTLAEGSSVAEQAANSGPAPHLREASTLHAPHPTTVASIEELQAQNSGSTSGSYHKAETDEVRWELDMAKKGIIKASSALPAASAAIEKSDEIEFKGWPMDLAARPARR